MDWIYVFLALSIDKTLPQNTISKKMLSFIRSKKDFDESYLYAKVDYAAYHDTNSGNVKRSKRKVASFFFIYFPARHA
jgi:hypothetical protein